MIGISSQAGVQSWVAADTGIHPAVCPSHPEGCTTWAEIQADAA